MIVLEDTLISEDILETNFVCQLDKCKGACCVKGDYGAPLEESEINQIEQNLPAIKSFMSVEGLALLNEKGFSETDPLEENVTTCRESGECVFVFYDENMHAKCAIEKAWESGKSDFRKPISCHLYPVRLKELGDHTALNYHKWDICSAACDKGNELNLPLYQFLKDALIRKFGEAWYKELDQLAEAWNTRA
jgi:hypothetical protein